MATAREIKRRIRSVKNINQVTRALEAVSASAVRRAQAAMQESRPYAEHAYEVLVNVAAQSTGVPLHALFDVRQPVRRVTVVLITSDRGLAGAYNTNIVRRAMEFVVRDQTPVHWITVGQKGRDLIRRWIARLQSDETAPDYLKDQQIVATFSNLSADPGSDDVASITGVALEEFLGKDGAPGVVEEVYIAYTHFINTMTQQPRVRQLIPLLPFDPRVRAMVGLVEEDPAVPQRNRDYIFEPSAERILEVVIPRFARLQLLQAIRESLASEHSARMVAMRNASESAETLSGELQLAFNKARQLAITSEILDIIGGVEALAQEG
ncbi:MAG: ATP synthase F1 subunit gamma [Anaerolineae bacterium]|nr:ATP synthase F1 subunit gamma [Anaerolineae bacterium]